MKDALARHLTEFVAHLTQPPSERYTTISAIMTHFDMSRWPIERALKRGDLKGVKICGRWRIPLGEFRRWLSEQNPGLELEPPLSLPPSIKELTPQNA